MTSISPVGIFRTDLDGRLTYGNHRFREITGHRGPLDELIGEMLHGFVHPDDQEAIQEPWHDAFRTRRAFTFEIRWGSQNSFRWAMGELVPESIGDEV